MNLKLFIASQYVVNVHMVVENGDVDESHDIQCADVQQRESSLLFDNSLVFSFMKHQQNVETVHLDDIDEETAL